MKAAAVFSSIEDADAEFELVTRSSDFSNFRFVCLEGYNPFNITTMTTDKNFSILLYLHVLFYSSFLEQNLCMSLSI